MKGGVFCAQMALSDELLRSHVSRMHHCPHHLLPRHLYFSSALDPTFSDPDLYSIKTERHLPALPPHGSGSCYTVLARSPSASGVGRGSVGGIGGGPSVLFMCELR